MEMTIEEKDRLVDAAIDAELAGDKAAAAEFLKKVPVPADFAMDMKNAVGGDIMRSLGYDYSEAEAKYGANWLQK
jgi:hypothetical protein